ncbi:GldG family protein [uncultured Ruminococcus sp.]|uniref:GldG family protein n=1 Tax=uncultured Ruminococcus sp. TaxID=165186 RepID=UPI0026232812|nr:GldG family protein [uncultured Ruminococcus sp.]
MKNQEKKAATPMSEEKRQNKLKRRKKLKYGSLATAVTVIFVAVVVLVNVVVSLIGNRFPDAVLDLTTSNVYDISDETLDYIRDLDQDVEIAVSSDESTFQTDKYNKMIAETISKYQGYSDHISVTYFDTTKDPDILAQYQELYGGTINSGKLIVTSGKRIKVYDCFTDMFELDQQKYQYYQYGMASLTDCITGFKGEQTLTSAIMNVTDSNPKAVGVISLSNGEMIYSQTQANYYAVNAAKSLLDDNGYDVTELDIVADALDKEQYDILLLPAPAQDLTTDAIAKLKDFLYNDGNLGKQLIYIADYSQSSTPNLDAFLKEWNVQIDRSIVRDEDSSSQTVSTLSGSGKVPIANVTADEDDKGYDGNLNNTSLPVVAPLTRPIDALTANNGRTVTSLLTTSGTSYRYPLSDVSDDAVSADDVAEQPTEDAAEAATEAAETTTSFDTSAAERGENTVMALCRDQQSTGSEFIESDVIVLGSMSLLDYNLVQDSAYNNAEYFIGLLNSVCGKEDSIVIAAKDLSQTSISATETQLKTIRTLVVFLIPLAVVVVGVIVAVRRRWR